MHLLDVEPSADVTLVNPRAAGADEVDGLGLVHGLHEPCDRHGERQVNDVGKCPVGKLGTELLHDQDLTVHSVVQLEAVVEHAVRSPVNLRRGDAVLGGLHALGGDVLLVVEIERLVGVQERMDDRQPLGAVHQVGLRPHGVEDAAGFRLDAGELTSRVVRSLGGDRVSQVAVATYVGHALAHLVVQDVVEHLRVVAGGVVPLTGDIEELAVADLLLEQRRVDDAHLDQRVRAELVVQARERGEHGFLLLVAHGVVAGVAEGYGGGEQALLDLADVALSLLDLQEKQVERGFEVLIVLAGLGHGEQRQQARQVVVLRREPVAQQRDEGGVQHLLGVLPEGVSRLAVAIGVHDVAVDERQDVGVRLHVLERVVVHGFIEIDGVERLHLVAVVREQEPRVLEERALGVGDEIARVELTDVRGDVVERLTGAGAAHDQNVQVSLALSHKRPSFLTLASRQGAGERDGDGGAGGRRGALREALVAPEAEIVLGADAVGVTGAGAVVALKSRRLPTHGDAVRADDALAARLYLVEQVPEVGGG